MVENSGLHDHFCSINLNWFKLTFVRAEYKKLDFANKFEL